MKTVHEKYMELTGKKPGKVMVLDNEENREAMKAHIEKHFDSSISTNGASIDEFVDVYRTTEGLDCEVLVRCKGKKESLYIEAKHIGNEDVQEVLRMLKVGGELHVHLKGRDYEEIAEQLRTYFAIQEAKPIKGKHKIGEMYEGKDGCLYVDAEVLNEDGFHMRKAAPFSEEAARYSSDIRVVKGTQVVNGKSTLHLLMLEAIQGTKLTIQAKGTDAEQARQSLYAFCQNNLNENQ